MGLRALEIHMSHEKVNMYKNYGDEFFNEHWENNNMQKTCLVLKDTIKNKQILDENQETIKQKNLHIKDSEKNIDDASTNLNKLNKFIDQSKQDLPTQLKMMQFS